MTGTAIYSDLFVFHSSDPTLTSASVKLNLNAIGTMAVGGPFASASVDLQANISTSLAGEIKSNINTTGPATCSSTFGGGAGCTGVIFSGGSLTTQSVVVGLNTPVLVQLRLDAVVTASAPGSSSSSKFSNSLDFPLGLALFLLDPGITVDAPDSFVTTTFLRRRTACRFPPHFHSLPAG